MNLQFFGASCITLTHGKTTIVCDPVTDVHVKDPSMVTLSRPGVFSHHLTGGKTLSLPGEFEISGVLVRGWYSDASQTNVVYKFVMEDISVVHLGDLPSVPALSFLENLGDNIDVCFVTVGEHLSVVDAKKVLETVSPRMGIFGGDKTLFPQVLEKTSASLAPENPIKITKSGLPDDQTDLMILPLEG